MLPHRRIIASKGRYSRLARSSFRKLNNENPQYPVTSLLQVGANPYQKLQTNTRM